MNRDRRCEPIWIAFAIAALALCVLVVPSCGPSECNPSVEPIGGWIAARCSSGCVWRVEWTAQGKGQGWLICNPPTAAIDGGVK